MELTEQIAVRVDKKTKQRVKDEVKLRRSTGACVDRADIVREALIEYFNRRPPYKLKEAA